MPRAEDAEEQTVPSGAPGGGRDPVVAPAAAPDRTVSEALTLVDVDGVILYQSPAIERLLGYRRGELSDAHLADVVHPDDLALTLEMLASGPHRPADVHFSIRMRHADGSWRSTDMVAADRLDHPALRALVLRVRDGSGRSTGELPAVHRYRLLAISDAAPIGILVGDCEGRVVYSNPAAEIATDLTADQLAGTGWLDAVHPDDRDGVAAAAREVLATAETVDRSFRLRHDPERWVCARLARQDSADGAPAGWVATVEDVTGRVEAERETARLTAILEASPDYVFTTDPNGQVLWMNNAMRLFVGDTPPPSLFDLYSPWAKEVFLAEVMPRLASRGLWRGELALNLIDRAEVPVSQVALAHRDGEGGISYLSVVLRDITDRKAIEAQLAHHATHDSLTRLPNRILLVDRLEKALARAHRHRSGVALLFCDLDGFKKVNDTYGHAAGDRLLKAVADRLQRVLREPDTVARFGGDEFVILCEDIADDSCARAVVDRVSASMSQPVDVGPALVVPGLSIGVAAASPDDNLDSLLRRADVAMYREKSAHQAEG